MTAKTAEWYNKAFGTSDEYHGSYQDSRYLPLWTAIVSMLFPEERVLDIGCGPGQFAQMCVEHGHEYIGVDFSKVAIDMAIKLALERTLFIQRDVSLLQPLPFMVNYDLIGVVTFVEVLEHLDNDIEVLDYYAKDKPVILTVPDFMAEGHVRCFNNEGEIRDRYTNFMFTRIEKIGRIFVAQGQSRNHKLVPQ